MWKEGTKVEGKLVGSVSKKKKSQEVKGGGEVTDEQVERVVDGMVFVFLGMGAEENFKTALKVRSLNILKESSPSFFGVVNGLAAASSIGI